jgi:hypothetical protein
MLELNDPLWNKLTTMLRNQRVPTLLSALVGSWDDETANSLLWEELSLSSERHRRCGRLIGIASLLYHGYDGQFTCASCGWGYEFIRFGGRLAVYADTPRGAPHEDKGLSDFKDGAPSRADGFMTPITEGGVLDARVAALLALAKRAPSPEPALLLRHFAGSFVCCKCGVQGPMHPPWRSAGAPRR